MASGPESLPDSKRLEIALALRDFHHKALWEEEKHFTWLVSIILSADVLLVTTSKLGVVFRSFLMLVVSLLGMDVCWIGQQVVRAESRNFQIALHRFIAQHNVYFDQPKLPQDHITAGELRQGKTDHRFVLALVTNALSESPALERWTASSFLKDFAFEPIQYWASASATARPNHGLQPPRNKAARG
ncbi:MAG: hypothetical protein ABSA52_05225 [Candidatus Binatia bacterium]|jgi:hypothetical protein